MKNLFIASLVISFFVVLYLLSAAARNVGIEAYVGAGAFLSFVAFVSYHVVVEMYSDYKALRKVTK